MLDGVSQDSLAALVALVCEGGIVEKQQVAFVLVCSCFTLLLFGKATEAVTLLKGNKNATKQELCDACGVGEAPNATSVALSHLCVSEW